MIRPRLVLWSFITLGLLIASSLRWRLEDISAASGTSISLTTLGAAYMQNFDTLASSGTSSFVPPGWGFSEAGSSADTTYAAGTGSSSTGNTYSFGSSGSTERAFGGLQSSSLIPTIGACFTNDTGVTITALVISYTGEQWRLGSAGRVDRLDFQYSTNATSLTSGTYVDFDALDFIAPVTSGSTGARDGNAAANRTVISATIDGLSIAHGASFFIRWTDFNASGSDDGLAVDDFSLTPLALPLLSVSDVTVKEGHGGTTTVALTVTLSAPAGPGGVRFDIATQDGTATVADNDYVPFSPNPLANQLIPEGSQTQSYEVTTSGDVNFEPDESFFVKVTNVTGASVAKGQGSVTITNDDTVTTLVSSANPSILDQPVTFTATVSAGTSGTPTGTVLFKAGGSPISTAIPLSGGVAAFTIASLAAGIHTITAEYSGDSDFSPSAGALTQIVNQATVKMTDPAACTGMGNILEVEVEITNRSNLEIGFEYLAQMPAPMVALAPFCTTTSGSCLVAATQVKVIGAIAAAQSTIIRYKVQLLNEVPPGTQFCLSSSVRFDVNRDGAFESSASIDECGETDCPGPGPGEVVPATATLSDQKAGSVLVYNLYSSHATNPAQENTRISITNTHPARAVAVHLFFVDNTSPSVADAYLCLTPNQTASFLMSDLDPGMSGYLVAVAVDSHGCPINFNYLIGDEYFKLASGHAANLGAEAFAALAGAPPVCDASSLVAELEFDGVHYNAAPRVLAVSSIPSPSEGNATLLVINRFGGSLMTGPSTIGTIFGLLFDDVERAYSFTFSASQRQRRSVLSNDLPRTTPRLTEVIPPGRTGWMKFWRSSDGALLGSVINFNPSAAANPSAFNQGHHLHKLTLTTAASLTIPIFPVACH